MVDIERALQHVQKPARYTGGELNSVVKDKSKINCRFAFCFPDTYEIGMSHIGIKILYSLINTYEDNWCERVFAPLPDMEEQMKKYNIPLFALESRDPISDFDFVGFTLQYEMSYTNILNMLDLGNIPIRSKDRDESHPLVIVGGPCVCNPEPIVDFVDIVSLGEGEEHLPEVIELYKKCKKEGYNKHDFLLKASKIKGTYIPSLYDCEYNEDGTLNKIVAKEGAPSTVTKRIITDMNNVYYPDKFIVPFISTVHDRAMEEIFRGCIRGCRFCQAGFIYRPVREKSAETILKQSQKLVETTGYDELSLASLSTSDHTDVENMLTKIIDWSCGDNVGVSLPSLRVDGFSDELVRQLERVKKSGLTFAPEAGTQRLRDAINKNVKEDELMQTCENAFKGGWTSVKLYFMLGLPTETIDDVAGIATLAQKVVDTFYHMPTKPKGRGVNVTISTACFVPKPFTPFQWEPQDTEAMLIEKQQHLRHSITSRKINYKYHDSKTSFLEAVLARGDRRLSDVIELAWKRGAKFDSWEEYFDFDMWAKCFEDCGLTMSFYANRKRDYSEVLPWDHIDFGISKEFLIRESKKSYEGVTTPHCRLQCSGCGVLKLGGGCDAANKNLV